MAVMIIGGQLISSYDSSAGSAFTKVVRRVIHITKSKSVVVDLDYKLRDVLVADPKIADAIVRTDKRIYVLGKDYGTTSITGFGASGAAIADIQIIVQPDVETLQSLLYRVLPSSDITVETASGNVILRGTVVDPKEAVTAAGVASRFLGIPEEVDDDVGLAFRSEEPAIQVLNLIKIRGKDQVTLQVSITEVNRSALKNLGINTDLFSPLGLPFALTNTTLSRQDVGFRFALGLEGKNQEISDVTGSAGLLQALEDHALIRTLAEPTLTAISGESASFLVGGEVPVPVASKDNDITLEFKPFGVHVSFVPIVLSEGRISLKVSTEISSVDRTVGYVTHGAVAIPGFKTRKANTTLEIPSGGTMVLAGLISDEISQEYKGIPGIMDIPILGALFRSKRFQGRQTELVMFVKPIIVQPVSAGALQEAGRNLHPPSDAASIFFNRLSRVYPVKQEVKTKQSRRYGHLFN